MNRPTIGQTNSLHTCDTFIGVDDGVDIESTAIETILAENNQLDIRFAGTELIIEGTAATAQLDIYSAAGQHMQRFTVDFTAGTATVPVSNLPAGIYIANVKEGNSKSSCKFMVK